MTYSWTEFSHNGCVCNCKPQHSELRDNIRRLTSELQAKELNERLVSVAVSHTKHISFLRFSQTDSTPGAALALLASRNPGTRLAPSEDPAAEVYELSSK